MKTPIRPSRTPSPTMRPVGTPSPLARLRRGLKPGAEVICWTTVQDEGETVAVRDDRGTILAAVQDWFTVRWERTGRVCDCSPLEIRSAK